MLTNTPIAPGEPELRIGVFQDTQRCLDYQFTGKLSGVRIYNHALSSAELLVNYRLDKSFGYLSKSPNFAKGFDGDRRSEIFISSPWAVGLLERSEDTFANPLIHGNGTRFGGWLLNTRDNRIG